MSWGQFGIVALVALAVCIVGFAVIAPINRAHEERTAGLDYYVPYPLAWRVVAIIVYFALIVFVVSTMATVIIFGMVTP